MVAGLQEINAIGTDPVHDPVLLGQSARPYPWGQVLQRFRLPDSRKRISDNGLNQIKRAQRSPPVSLNPVAEILNELRVEDSVAGAAR